MKKHEYAPKAHVNDAFEVVWACRHCYPSKTDTGYVIRRFDSREAAQAFADETNSRHPYETEDFGHVTGPNPPGVTQ